MHSFFTEEIKTLLKVSDEEITPLSCEEQEEYYAAGFSLYEQGNYTTAGRIFTQLVLTDPFSEKVWRGLAAAKQMEGEHLASLHAWSMAALLNEADPLPHFHAAECLLSLHEKNDALKALALAKEKCCNNRALRDKIDLLIVTNGGSHDI
jgi:type III secretion system low calcium response chaperone LcrH/SycD